MANYLFELSIIFSNSVQVTVHFQYPGLAAGSVRVKWLKKENLMYSVSGKNYTIKHSVKEE